MSGILGTKIGMTRVIDDNGNVVPVSVVECTPNEIVHVKTTAKDGYPALVLGFAAYNKPTKTQKWQHVAEFRLAADTELKKGDKVTVQDFAEIAQLKVTGFAKGRGFAGVIKRHHFSRGPETHGSHHHREPGSSSGAVTGTGRVPKGKRYPGHLGTQKVTTRGVKLVKIDAERNLLVIKGALPGAPGGLIKIISA